MKRIRSFGLHGWLFALLGAPLGASACGPDDTYIGTVCTVAMNWCPQNYVQADGRTLPINNYQALYSLIGNTYGGNATQGTFGVPDLRGRSVVGTGQGSGTSNVVWGQQLGQPAVTLNANQLPQHTHPATFTGVGGGQVTIPATTGNLTVAASLPVATAPAGNATLASGSNYITSMTGNVGASSVKFVGPFSQSAPATPAAANLPATVTTSGTAGTPEIKFSSGITGGTVAVGPNPTAGTALPTQSPGLGMMVCIAVNGLYPSRP